MKPLIALMALTLPLCADQIIIKPAQGNGEAVKVDVSGPAKIVLGGIAYHIEPADKPFTQIKAEKLTIPTINFEEVQIQDAIEFIRMRSMELDPVDKDPRHRGLNIVLHGKFPNVIDDLRVRNVTLHEALRLIALKTGATVEYRDEVVMIIGQQ